MHFIPFQFIVENRSGNRTSSAEQESAGVQTTREEAEYPDLLNGNESASVGNSHNE